MSTSNASVRGLSVQLQFAIYFITAITCICSIWQAGGFLSRLGASPQEQYIFYAASTALILGSILLSLMLGVAATRKAPFWIVGLCLVMMAGLESFSIGTSLAGFDSRATETADRQNSTSPQYKAALDDIALLEGQIKSRQENADRLPANYISIRARELTAIDGMMARLQKKREDLEKIQVSSTAKTFANIESTLGISQTHISLLGAILLSALPLSLMVVSGYLNNSNNEVAGQAQANSQVVEQGRVREYIEPARESYNAALDAARDDLESGEIESLSLRGGSGRYRVSQDTIREIQRKLVAEGVLQKSGQQYVRKAA